MIKRDGEISPTTRRGMLAMALASIAVGARAQTTDGAYPNRPVRIILPAAPGGPTDVMARVISPGLHARFGQPVIIVNRAGAGGNIGVVQAAKSPPDGYTLLISSTGFVVNPSLYRDPGYDPFRDFIPITELGSSPNVILVLPSSGIASLADLVAKAKADNEQTERHQPGTGLDAASDGRAAAAPRRHRRGEHSLQRRRPGHPGAAGEHHAGRHHGIAARAPAHQVGRVARARHHRREALVRSARRPDDGGSGLQGPGLRDVPGNVRPGRHARRRSSSAWRATRSTFWPNPRFSRSCAASASTCAPAARRGSRSESPARCRCGATSSSSRASSCSRRLDLPAARARRCCSA